MVSSVADKIISLIQGPSVVIQVELSIFAIPQKLVYYYSAHLKDAFKAQISQVQQEQENENLIVGQPRVHLKYEQADVFGAVAQW